MRKQQHSKAARQPEPAVGQAEQKPMRIQLIEAEVARWPDWQRCFYEWMVECGNAPVLAHMLACRQAPLMGQSDRSFCESQHQKMAGMSTQQRQAMVEIARRAGINTDGKFYVSGLGTYNDPTAWCSTIEDARTALAMKPHLNATGLVTKTATLRPEGPPQRKLLADDLAAEMIGKEMHDDPALAEKVRKGKVRHGDLRAMVEDKYSYKPEKEVPLSPMARKLKDAVGKKMKERMKQRRNQTVS